MSPPERPPQHRGIVFFCSVEVLPASGWVTLCSFNGKGLLELYLKPYEDLKDKFVRCRWRDGESMLTKEATYTLAFLYHEQRTLILSK